MRLTADRPRPHHYHFAHGYLRRLVLESPIDFMGLAADGSLDARLSLSWQSVGARFADAERLPADGLSSAVASIGETTIVVVTMPPAQHVTEVHYAAIVPAATIRGSEVARRYLVLEHSWNLDDSPATVLGEWTTEGHHVNFGDGPRPQAAAFVAAVERLLAD